MGLLEFIMMKNLFGNTGGSGNGAQPSVVGASWHIDGEYESIGGAGYKISNLTPTIDDLQTNITIFYDGNPIVLKLNVVQNDPFISLQASINDEPTDVFIIIHEPLDLGGLTFSAGVYFNPGVFQGENISGAYLIWEPTS